MTYGQSPLRQMLYKRLEEDAANALLQKDAQAISETLGGDQSLYVAAWANYSPDDFVSLWSATCLSAGIDPRHSAARDEGFAQRVVALGSATDDCIKGLQEVLRRYKNVRDNADIADSGLKLNRHKKIELSEFMNWAARKNWKVLKGLFGAPVSLARAEQLSVTLPRPAPVVAAGASGGVEADKAAQVKPLQRTAAQDSAILAAIRQAGADPLKLPKNNPGKPGIKARTRAALVGVDPLFQRESTVFKKAWDRLRERGEIVDNA